MRRSTLSGQIRVMQRPELVTTRRPAAATAVELEQHGNSERKEMTEKRGVAEGPSGRPIYKGELISGRENQGDHGVVISPRNASIFGMAVKIRSVADLVE